MKGKETMKTMHLTIQRNIIVTMTVILAVLTGTVQVAAVEYKNVYQPSANMTQHYDGYQAAAPAAAFQSTSTLAGSGSAYSAMPMLGSDGTATYDGAEAPGAPSGPRRVGPPTPEDDPTPVGDAALPLMLLALAYLIWCAARRRSRALE